MADGAVPLETATVADSPVVSSDERVGGARSRGHTVVMMLGFPLPGADNTGSSGAHCSSVWSVENDMAQTVSSGLTGAVEAE